MKLTIISVTTWIGCCSYQLFFGTQQLVFQFFFAGPTLIFWRGQISILRSNILNNCKLCIHYYEVFKKFWGAMAPLLSVAPPLARIDKIILMRYIPWIRAVKSQVQSDFIGIIIFFDCFSRLQQPHWRVHNIKFVYIAVQYLVWL